MERRFRNTHTMATQFHLQGFLENDEMGTGSWGSLQFNVSNLLLIKTLDALDFYFISKAQVFLLQFQIPNFTFLNHPA